MIALQIEDMKEFTRQLFTGETFDRFLCREARFVTFCGFTIDGSLRQDYFSEEELEHARMEEHASWGMLRPICFHLIRGKKLPQSFSIVLSLPPAGVQRFLAEKSPAGQNELVGGLYLNIRYENRRLLCVSGVSLTGFSPDKTAEHAWDDAVKAFFRKAKIACTEA